MVGSLILYNAGSRNIAMKRNIKRRREWHTRGSAAASPESNSPPHQRMRRPSSRTLEGKLRSRREEKRRGPRRAAEEGRRVPRSTTDFEEDACISLASRTDPASNENSRSGDIDGPCKD